MQVPVWVWIAFTAFVLMMLILDLCVFHRHAHRVKMREALAWVAVWVTLALLFNAGVYSFLGGDAALQFLAGYLLEYSLSVDNMFVFLLIFAYFRVPQAYQHRVLFWGILGAIVMRAIFIAAGVALMQAFHWIIYVFGALLVVSGIKMALQEHKEIHPERNLVLRIFRRLFPVTEEFSDRFFVRKNGRLLATPLLLVLLLVETTDLIFAVDSIPAILAITQDPFIVYTSNVFAILGLRALYFALAGLMLVFRYLNYGLSAILVFVGAKMLLADVYKVPLPAALGTIAAILLLSMLVSLLHRPAEAGRRAASDEPARSLDPTETPSP
jgi:tellurite resistance protein TerC